MVPQFPHIVMHPTAAALPGIGTFAIGRESKFPAWHFLPLNHQCLFLLVFWIPSIIFKMVLKVFAHDEECPVRSCSSLDSGHCHGEMSSAQKKL